MNPNQNTEQRKLPRLLCSGGFSASKVVFGDQTFELGSINYTHDGMALFKSDPLPEGGTFTISFSYPVEDRLVEISDLPCTLVHVRDAGEGFYYGASFDLEAATSQQIADLIRIEEEIAVEQHRDR
ncbi:MAG: hypothetical protein CME36_16035 [unclassified Hahellaceae]|nr:hypothetical protein [Hahellaceae bacterium]|tara:strand:- start:46843 stop:47220 length:378 start_codon:yes stop_codon:yes gene_type:complete